jgi:radical SAM superfamily enzyme YgiQ (UPF0313 family)
MKLLLVNPIFGTTTFAPTLGLGFIGTYVREHSDFEVEIVEPISRSISEKQVLKKAKESDVVGLTCYTESRFRCFDFARKVKNENPDCKLVIGGPHVNALDEQILKHYPFVDAVVRMEGEEAMFEIVKNEPFKKILGITWRSNGKIVRNPDRPMIKEINNLHFDYSLIFSEIKQWKDFEVPRELQKVNHLPIIASRGCPFQCTFCAAHEQWARVYRSLSPDEVIKRMDYLVSQYDIGYFRFYDALFMASDKKILEFCDLLKKSKLNVSFRIDLRVGTSKEVLKRLREVGCDVVGFGIESGSNRILKRINKGITREQIERTIRECIELDYWTIGYFMMALPDETPEDIKKTLELLKFFDEINIQFFKIHPNTAFYYELKQRGEINDGAWFDPKYGNEIFYCKENFPSANFYRNEIDYAIWHASSYHNVHSPISVIRKYGLTKGVAALYFSAANVLSKGKASRALNALKRP